MHPSLTVCVPTVGVAYSRTLHATLASILPQLESDDQLIVDQTPGAWGYPARSRMSRQVDGDFALFMDDDDLYLPDAFQIIRETIAEDRTSLHIYRGQWPDNRMLWETPEIRETNVSTQLVAVPRELAHTVEWGRRYAGDYDFIAAAANETDVVWHLHVICEVFPKGPDVCITRPERALAA